MRYLIGFVLAVVLFAGGLLARPVIAGYVQDFAWQQKVASNPYPGEVDRFEWFSDVCYTMTGGTGVAISCVKK